MLAGLLLLSVASVPASVTLEEAREMSGSELAERLLPGQSHGQIVDVILNGRGLTPPSRSLNQLWLVEQMVPFDAVTCRSHVNRIELQPNNPAANMWIASVPTHVAKVEQYDRLWVPIGGTVTVDSCAASPPQASGFGDGGLGLPQASELVRQARLAFALDGKRRKFRLKCSGERQLCGAEARRTLAAIDWSKLGLVERVSEAGEPLYTDNPAPVDKGWGPSNVQDRKSVV